MSKYDVYIMYICIIIAFYLHINLIHEKFGMLAEKSYWQMNTKNFKTFDTYLLF